MTAVDSILARLLALHPKRIDLSLERMWRVLERLGHPERRAPPVIAPQTAAASAVLERQAERVRAPLHVAGQHWHAHVENGRLVYQDEQGLLDLPPPKLFGRHQFDNAGTAIAALRAAGIRLP